MTGINFISDWNNKWRIPDRFDRNEEYAYDLITTRRIILINAYLRYGLDKPIMQMKEFATNCFKLKHMQSAWGWEGYNFYDNLFKDFRHVQSARQLITNKGCDPLLVAAATKWLESAEARKRQEEALAQ